MPAIQPPRVEALAGVPHAIPYQGSKRVLAHAIVRLLPADTEAIVEPFAGSAAVSLGARHIGAARSAVLNDVNAPLVGLWRRILDDPDGLAGDYAGLWHAQLGDPRAFYDAARVRFNDTGEPHLLLYLLNRCVKAAVRYSRAGGFNQSADHRRLGARPDVVRRRIGQAAATLARATVTCGDYERVLLGTGPGSVCYLDPPYQGVTRGGDHRYLRGLERPVFEAVLREAVAADISFVVSYDVVSADKRYGSALASDLDLTHIHVSAGRSAQGTLSRRRIDTVESLYLSPALVTRLGGEAAVRARLTGADVGPCAPLRADDQETRMVDIRPDRSLDHEGGAVAAAGS